MLQRSDHHFQLDYDLIVYSAKEPEASYPAEQLAHQTVAQPNGGRSVYAASLYLLSFFLFFLFAFHFVALCFRKDSGPTLGNVHFEDIVEKKPVMCEYDASFSIL
jgi:hypothetical protein